MVKVLHCEVYFRTVKYSHMIAEAYVSFEYGIYLQLKICKAHCFFYIESSKNVGLY